MSQSEAVLAFMSVVEKGLHRRLLLDAAFSRLPKVAALALVPAAFWWLVPGAQSLVAWPDGIVSALLWLALVMLGLGVLLVPNVLRRPGPVMAAAWLDRRLETRELFSAALATAGHAEPGPFDEPVIAAAAARISAVSADAVRLFPQRPLRIAGLRSLAIILVGLVMVVAWPGLAGAGGNRMVGSDSAVAVPELGDQDEAPVAELRPPAEMEADRLFPTDQRLSDLAAEAITEGDAEALRYLLDQAEKNPAGADGDPALVLPGQRQAPLGSRSERGSRSGKPDRGASRGKGQSGDEENGADRQSGSDKSTGTNPDLEKGGREGKGQGDGSPGSSGEGQSRSGNSGELPWEGEGQAAAWRRPSSTKILSVPISGPCPRRSIDEQHN